MNGIFSSFRFGSLIKTFLPGSVLLTAFIFLLESYGWPIFSQIRVSSEVFLTVFIIGSLILGITSNTIVFAGLNDWIIRNRHKKHLKNKEFYDLNKKFCDLVVQHYIQSAFSIESKFQNKKLCGGPISPLDVEIALEAVGNRETFFALREAYWYYLEYQMNMAIAVTVLGLSIELWLIANSSTVLPTTPLWLIQMLVLLATIGHLVLVVHSAQKNYDRHVKKMFSLMLVVFVDCKSKGNS